MPAINEFLDVLHSDLRDYVQSYFDDETSDFTAEGIHDFLLPFAEEYEFDMDKLEQIVLEYCRDEDEVLHKLDEEVVINSNVQRMGFDGKRGDIRHAHTSNRRTVVDLKKLKNAERKLKTKSQKRNGIEIEEWNPNMKPSMVVNQQKTVLTSGSKDIKIENFDIQFAGNVILENANLTLAYGRRYGLVGKNGIGKSTLLRAISSGELIVNPGMRILHVEQELVGDELSAIASVLKADTVREGLLKEEKDLINTIGSNSASKTQHDSASARLKQVYRELEEIESDKAESRAAAILSGLGFSAEKQKDATNTFSGGWRMRLALARALFCKPDFLLADEVTNHLGGLN
jgi:ATP-binding cassette subfamily F protein 3